MSEQRFEIIDKKISEIRYPFTYPELSLTTVIQKTGVKRVGKTRNWKRK